MWRCLCNADVFVFHCVGVSDQLLQQTYTIPGLSPPPSVGSFIFVVVTAIASHMRFYVHVLGDVASLASNRNNSLSELMTCQLSMFFCRLP